MKVQIEGPEQLDVLAGQMLEMAGGRRVFAFTGEIGAGKTTFIQAICRRLGVTGEVTSPTFALVNEYQGAEARIYHLDLYRLTDVEEALGIGIEELLDIGDYCLIEWPGLIEGLLPDDTVRINLEIVGNSTRKILFL